MKQEQWSQMHEPVPQAVDQRLASVLSRLEEEPARRRAPLRTAVIALALLLALGGVAYAVLTSQTADFFGWFHGPAKRESLLAGDIAAEAQSYTLGDVMYTLEEVVYQNGMLYGIGTMRPKEGAGVVLMASDHYLWEPAGYVLHIGEEQIPPDAPTYLELAQQQDARILMPICQAQGFMREDGTLSCSEVGIITVPRPDGTIRFTFEFQGYEGEIQRASSYAIRLRVANWEVSREGEHLRQEPQDTYVGADWDVTVTPERKGEGR